MTTRRIAAVMCLVLTAAPALNTQAGAPPDLLEATRWYTGVAGRVDDERARALLEQAAATGDPLARMWVARCYSRGRMGYARDVDRARARAAEVIADVRRAADAGVLEAVFLMGTAYDEGLGVIEDPAAAIGWFRRAAERGHVLARHNLGNAYAAGRGVAKNEALAVEWWLRAAHEGDAIPQLRLGEAYEQGRGVVTDLAEARRWYGEAARRGNAAAHTAWLRLSEQLASAAPQNATTEVAFVANAEAGTVVLVDPVARTVLGMVDVNPARVRRAGPGSPNFAQDTDVSPDGRVLYVSRGHLGDVAAFDIASGRQLWERSLDTGRADHMTITADGRSLFVSALLDNRVYRLAATTGAVTGHVVTGVYPHDVKISRDGRRLYNSSLGPLASYPRPASAPPLKDTPGHPFELTVADVDTLQIVERIKLDNAFRPWQFTLDERAIYAQRSNEHAVVAYDLGVRAIVKRLDLPIAPGVTVKDWDFESPHHGLALTDDGRTICVAGRASDYAALIAAPDLALLATIPVGDAPGWAEVADGGRVCLVANTRSDDLSFVSIADRKEVARLPMGDGPKHITVARVPAAVIAAVQARR